MVVNTVGLSSETQTAEIVVTGGVVFTLHVVKSADQGIDVTSELFGGVCDIRVGEP